MTISYFTTEFFPIIYTPGRLMAGTYKSPMKRKENEFSPNIQKKICSSRSSSGGIKTKQPQVDPRAPNHPLRDRHLPITGRCLRRGPCTRPRARRPKTIRLAVKMDPSRRGKKTHPNVVDIPYPPPKKNTRDWRGS